MRRLTFFIILFVILLGLWRLNHSIRLSQETQAHRTRIRIPPR
jgi:hypothetical protein